MAKEESAKLELIAVLKGHNGWVTSLATPKNNLIPGLLSGSRDKTAIMWDIKSTALALSEAKYSYRKHGSYVQCVDFSSNMQFMVTSSWDQTAAIWNLNTNKCQKTLCGHTGDVMGCAISPDDKNIYTVSRDCTIKLWDCNGNQLLSKKTDDWINCIAICNKNDQTFILTGHANNEVIQWSSKLNIEANYVGHTSPIQAISISPDGTLAATGAKSGDVNLWDISQKIYVSSPINKEPVNALAFNPSQYWLAIATIKRVKIWHLNFKKTIKEIVVEVQRNGKDEIIQPLSIAWSRDGKTLYVGFEDGKIRLYGDNQVTGGGVVLNDVII